MNRVLFNLSLVAVLAGWAGCATTPTPAPAPTAPPVPADTAARSSPETFVTLDSATSGSLALAAVQAYVRPDGRREVLASLRNEAATPLRLSVACFFKTAAGAVTGEAIVWHPLALAGRATETVRFTAADTRAERFTLAARGASGP